MTDGGADEDAINVTSLRSKTRPWIVIAAGVVLIGSAVVLLLLPITVRMTWEYPATTRTIDCGRPFTSPPKVAWTKPTPCSEPFHMARITSGLLAVAGAGLITAATVVRRRHRAEVSGDAAPVPRAGRHPVLLAGVGVAALYLLLTFAMPTSVPRLNVLPSPGWIPGPDNMSNIGNSYLTWERGPTYWREVRYCLPEPTPLVPGQIDTGIDDRC